ncbi:hypothetical protein [Sorangium cellulosum]|uniref:Uncharacterized protein n=1 Tax=Sorangium cellulosum So0157-2 TaxID=1254432 RepID=S4Y874_SORCE|nr:hypothetical protein [Sorangium cellulosum]AGP40576.1 hypothetical protein SCE1572_42410 [Sorangium cellulosum So0157-2]
MPPSALAAIPSGATKGGPAAISVEPAPPRARVLKTPALPPASIAVKYTYAAPASGVASNAIAGASVEIA